MPALESSQSVSRRGAEAPIDCSAVVSFPGQSRLDLAHARVPAVVFGLRVFVRGVPVIVIAVIIIVGIWVAVVPAPGIEAWIESQPKNYPGIVVPMATVAMPEMVPTPVPVWMLAGAVPRDNAAAFVEGLRTQSSCASRRRPGSEAGIDSGIVGGCASDSQPRSRGNSTAKRCLRREAGGWAGTRVGPVSKRRLGGEARGRAIETRRARKAAGTAGRIPGGP